MRVGDVSFRTVAGDEAVRVGADPAGSRCLRWYTTSCCLACSLSTTAWGTAGQTLLVA